MAELILLMILANPLNSYNCDSFVEIPEEVVEALKNQEDGYITILESNSKGDIYYLRYDQLYLQGKFHLVDGNLFACEILAVHRYEQDGTVFIVYRVDVLS